MNTREEKEKLQKYTIGYLIAMVVIFVVVLIGVRSPGLKTVALIGTVLLFAALIVLQWRKANAPGSEDSPSLPTEKAATTPEVKAPAKQEKKPAPAPSKKEVPKKIDKENPTGLTTKTGSVCMEPGSYHCSKHPHRTAAMDEGKRFPPCRGDKKGHSAIWVLDEK